MFTSNYTGSDIDAAVGKVLDGKIGGMTEITYKELVELRNKSELIPGMQYRITDYMTTTSQENTKTAGHQFDIIVTADSTNILNEKARAIHHDFSESEEEDYFANSNLAAWEIWYCLDNDEERFVWTSNDPNKLDEIFKVEYTDNNNVPHITTTSNKKKYVKEVLGYGTNIDEYQGGAGGGLGLGPVTETYSPIENDKTKLINDSKFYTYGSGTHFEDTINHYTANNVFYVSASNYFIAVDTSKSYELLLTPACEETAKSYIIEANKPVKWYNVHTCDFNGNVSNRKISNIFIPDTYKELLENGKSFQILSYDGIVELGDYVFNKAYNIYNKTGVIYRMIDEWNNDCPYDFKNIQFKRWKLNTAQKTLSTDYNDILLSTINKALNSNDKFYAFSYIWSGTNDEKKYWDYNGNIYSDTTGETNFFYTFSLIDDNDVITDNSLNPGTAKCAYCYSNTIEKKDSLYKAILNNNIFLNHKIYNYLNYYCYFNNLGYYCYNNTFSCKAISNHLGNACSNNIFGIDCSNNSFGNSCSNNIINTKYTSFGNDCSYNIFRYGGDGYGNIFGNFVEKNIFGNYCQYNTFGNDCKYNYFGGLCEHNTFGNGCDSVKNKSNKTAYNIFGNKCNITLSEDTTFAFYINSKKVKITYE